MFELETVRSVTDGDTCATFKDLRERLCNASAEIPVQRFGDFHRRAGELASLLSGYIRTLERPRFEPPPR